MPKLSIVFPVYNEEKRLPETLKTYLEFFDKKLPNDYEIVLVPNNCKDSTPQLAESYSIQHKPVTYTNEFKDKYIGKGGAIIEGFKIAQGDYIGFVDADGSTPPEYYYDLLHNIGNKDGIIASRWMPGAKVEIKQTLTRQIASRSFNLLINTLFGLNIKDTQCGAKIFKKKAVKSILPELITFYWAFDTDLLYSMKRKGFNVKEIPTKWDDAEGSQLNVKNASQQMLKSIIRLRLHHSPLKRWTKK
tara:strand:- start:672 stop:1409 length:738 start_codon:yes stop_codon:yes gene_type:complete